MTYKFEKAYPNYSLNMLMYMCFAYSLHNYATDRHSSSFYPTKIWKYTVIKLLIQETCIASSKAFLQRTQSFDNAFP